MGVRRRKERVDPRKGDEEGSERGGDLVEVAWRGWRSLAPAKAIERGRVCEGLLWKW